MKTRRIPQPEPLWYLRGLAHSAYLQTDHWRLRRESFLHTRGQDRSCDFCGIKEIDAVHEEQSWFSDYAGNECSSRKKDARLVKRTLVVRRQPAWHVHHLNYDRLGEELDSDLELLCAPCHNLKHFPHSAAAHHWAALRGPAFKADLPRQRPDTLTRDFVPVSDLPEIESAAPLDGFVDIDLYPDPFA